MIRVKVKVWALVPWFLSLSFCSLTWAIETDSTWSIYLIGSSTDRGNAIAVDESGCAYVTGETFSVNFPTTAAGFDTTYNGGKDAFVIKLNATGSTLVYSTFMGGWGLDECGYDIAVDDSGHSYVIGIAESNNFPSTVGAYDETYNGYSDAFVAKLNPAGSDLIYCTFLGAGHYDQGRGLALDDSGNVYVTGYTCSRNFPTTAGAFETQHHGGIALNGGYYDVFAAKINSTGSDLVYSTFLGGSYGDWGYDIALDDSGYVYVTGRTYSADFPTTPGVFDTIHNGDLWWDIFVTKINPTGRALAYSTFLGGTSQEEGWGIAVDNSGSAYVTGYTYSDDFPTTAGAFDETYNSRDVFVTKLNSKGTALAYSTFLGGSNYWGEAGHGIIVDDSGSVYVTGFTESSDFPTTVGAFDTEKNPGWDIFVAKLNSTGSDLDYATYVGGNNWEFAYDIAVDGSGNAYVTGRTCSYDFPTTAGAFDTTHQGCEDVFVAKLNPVGSALDYATYVGGDSFPSVPVESEAPITELPKAYVLHQNHPNPFNSTTEVCYQIPQDEHVTLKVFNTLGQEVRTLMKASQETGSHRISWNGRDDEGREVVSGVYFCRLKAGDFSKTIKMVLLR